MNDFNYLVTGSFAKCLNADINAVATKAGAKEGEPHWATDTNQLYVYDADADAMVLINRNTIDLSFETYDPQPARASESNVHGGLLALATGQPLDSVPTDLVVTKGIGKVMIVVNAGSDIAGEITITGTSVDRDTGATTPADTDVITVDALTTDNSTAVGKGSVATKHDFTGAYISSKWFVGTVTLSTTNLTLTDVDVYHISFEQFNDSPNVTVDTLDVNLVTTDIRAEFDAYLYCLEVTGSKCDIASIADIHVGTDGITAVANKYERLRRGSIGHAMDGTTDGVWVDIQYLNSPAYVEDVTLKVWASKIITS